METLVCLVVLVAMIGGAVIDAFAGHTYQRRPKAAQAGDMDSNTI
jgi:hypothetical protein